MKMRFWPLALVLLIFSLGFSFNSVTPEPTRDVIAVDNVGPPVVAEIQNSDLVILTPLAEGQAVYIRAQESSNIIIREDEKTPLALASKTQFKQKHNIKSYEHLRPDKNPIAVTRYNVLEKRLL